MNDFLQFLDRRSATVLFILTLLFLGIETCYAVHRPLSLDEFNGAGSVAHVGDGVPYRDYQPYKPVLGYYAQLALMHLGSNTWNGYIAVRLGMVFLTVGVLFLGALWLRRTFRRPAICLAYALLVVMTSLVEWAIEVRLDMATALFGFVSLLLLMNRRVALAGVVAGVSFLISQKGTMYALAGGVSLLGGLIVQRDRRYWRDLPVYGICVLAPIGLYVLFWSLLASFSQVCGRVFAEPTQLHALTTPAQTANVYCNSWLETLFRNPFYYACGLWALASLLFLGRTPRPRDTLLLCYGGTVALVMLSLRQPWAYSFVLLIPTLFVLHVDLFSRELGRPESFQRRPLGWLCFVVLGLLLPLFRVPLVVRADAGGQRQTVELTEALLEPGDRYFAGFHFLYGSDRHSQALPILDINGARPIQELTPAECAAILQDFQKEPIRVVIYSFKIDDELPELLRQHVYRNYAPFWANVWIYAPQVQPSDESVQLLFTDSYTIQTEEPQVVRIDGQTYSSGETVELTRGRHTIETPVRLRLKLEAARVAHLLKPAYQEPTGFFWPNLNPASEQGRNGVWVD